MKNEEFDAKFPNLGAPDPKEGWYDAKPEVKDFIATSIHQAEQETEVKVRLEIFQMLHKRIMERKQDLNQIDILELLQKELLDNLKE